MAMPPRCLMASRPAVPQRLPIHAFLREQPSLAIQDLCEQTRRVGRNVQDHAERCGKVGRERMHDTDERVDASGGSSDDDDSLF